MASDMETRSRWQQAAAVVVLQALSVTLLLPATPINLIAGYLLGAVVGGAASVLGIMLAAVVSFLAARTLLLPCVEEYISRRKDLLAIFAALEARQFSSVLLLTLAPAIPAGVLHYVLGVAPVTFAQYTAATFVGLLPTTMATAYVGAELDSAREAFQHPERAGPRGLALILVNVALTVVAVVWIGRVAARALKLPPPLSPTTAAAAATAGGGADGPAELRGVHVGYGTACEGETTQRGWVHYGPLV